MKNKKHLFLIAFRQLSQRKRQSILSLAGISVGVMVLITAISLMNGLVESFVQKIINIAPHVLVSGEKMLPLVPDQLIKPGKNSEVNFIKNVYRSDEEVIKNYKKIMDLIEQDSLVEMATPLVGLNTIGKFGTTTLPVQLFGIIPSSQDKIEKFKKSMISGNYDQLERTPDGILLGTSAAQDFSAKVGDRIQIVANNGNIFSLRVIGIFSTGINDIDGNVYVNLKLAQNIGGYPPNEVTDIYIRVNNLKKDYLVADNIKNLTNYKAITWEEKASSVLALFKMISMIVYFLVFFVVLVAGFGVANVLITNVLEKTRDIAILKSIGFKKSEITVIYIFQGLIVAIIGAAIGCLLGYGMIEILSSIKIASSSSSAVRADRLLMGKNLWYFTFSFGFAVLVSLIASIIPARNAAKVNPVEILRGEK